MQPRIKMGLAIGAVGLALNVCVAGFIGLCGPLVSLLAGGLAHHDVAERADGGQVQRNADGLQADGREALSGGDVERLGGETGEGGLEAVRDRAAAARREDLVAAAVRADGERGAGERRDVRDAGARADAAAVSLRLEVARAL